MADMNAKPGRSANAQIATRIHDSDPDSSFLQRVNRPIDGKTFGDAAKIDNYAPAKKDFVALLEKDVPRSRHVIEAITTRRKIMPIRKKRSDSDIERSVTLARELLCRF
jgi:hypothetical protein